MAVEAINVSGNALYQAGKTTETIDKARKNVQQDEPDLATAETSSETSVQPEELLSQIKSITEDGLYSVRFENSSEFDNALIVKVVDIESDEVIRQVPAEELLGVRAALEELRGNIVNTVS
jgi:flagellar protein FlaG